MKRPIPNGLLVAIEGIDGAGKTSVATVLAQWCGENGLGCMISKEPTGRKYGAKLRESSRAGRLSLDEELALFIEDRKDHVETSIAPSLAEGNIVILDRYYWSTAAYQGCRGADYRKIIEMNEAFAPRPDLFIVLDVDVDAGLQRIRMRGDKPNEFETKASLIQARAIFNQLVEQSHGFAVSVDSSGALKDTFPDVFRAFCRKAVDKIGTNGPLVPEMLNQTLVFLGGKPIDRPAANHS
jgi:dTMP kinase